MRARIAAVVVGFSRIGKGEEFMLRAAVAIATADARA
jgi:hypothetical protein